MVRILERRALPRLVRDAQPQLLVREHRGECPGESDWIGHGHRDCRLLCPLGDVPDRRADGGNARRGSLERHERAGLVPRRHDDEVGGFDRRAQPPLRQRDQWRARYGNRRGGAQREALADAPAHGQHAAVADVGQRDGFTTGNMHQARNAQQRGRADRYETARPRPYRLHDVEMSRTVSGENCPQARPLPADVVDVCPDEPPVGGLSVLRKGENLDVVAARQPLEQRQQRRDDPVLSRSVDAAGHHQSDVLAGGPRPMRAQP